MFKRAYWKSNYKSYTLSNMLKVVSEVIKKSNYYFEYIDLGGGMGIKYNKKIKI